MGALSIWHILVVVVLVVLLFGKGKLTGLMGDLAGGIKAFKKGMADEPGAGSADRIASRDGEAPKN